MDNLKMKYIDKDTGFYDESFISDYGNKITIGNPYEIECLLINDDSDICIQVVKKLCSNKNIVVHMHDGMILIIGNNLNIIRNALDNINIDYAINKISGSCLFKQLFTPCLDSIKNKTYRK